MSYAARNRRPPGTLTDREVRRLLAVSGRTREGLRDHVIFSLALGCALRESEIVGLDLGDVLTLDGNIRRVIQLRVFKRAGEKTDARAQRVHLPEATHYKLDKLIRVEQLTRQPRTRPLFMSRKGNRLSTRAVRALFHRWQIAAGFDQLYNFHRLRHTAITVVRRRTKDVRIAQRFARHASINTTMIYEHASDEEIAGAVRDLDV